MRIRKQKVAKFTSSDKEKCNNEMKLRWQDNSGGLFAPQFKNIRGQTNSEKFGEIPKQKKFVFPEYSYFCFNLPSNSLKNFLFSNNSGAFTINYFPK